MFDPFNLRLWRTAFILCLASVLALALLPSSVSIPLDTGWDKSNHARHPS